MSTKFANRASSELDAALNGSVRRPEPPTWLGPSIRMALRGVESHVEARRSTWPRALPFSVLALLLVVVFCLIRLPTKAPADLRVAGATLDLAQQLARTAPAAVTAPISRELLNLDLDLDKTEQFLLASLP